MKKLLSLFTLLVGAFTLSSCGNVSVGFGNYSYNYIHVIPSNVCFEIDKWYEDSIGIEVKTVDDGYFYFSEGTYILVEAPNGYCPICENL